VSERVLSERALNRAPLAAPERLNQLLLDFL